MQFRILGPVEVWDNGEPLSLGGPQQRALLAVLLLNANRVVSADRLVADLWGDHPPPDARRLLRGCVTRLRRALRHDRSGTHADPLLTRPPGYLLAVAPGTMDTHRVDELEAAAHRVLAAHAPGALDRAAELLREALELWRGPALDDLAIGRCRAYAARLEERRLALLEQRIDLDLSAGRHSELVGELTVHVQAQPLRERLWAQLMLALSGADRRADALAAYRRLRQLLVDELGMEPSPTLQQLERAILTDGDAFEVYRRAYGYPAGDARPGRERTGPAPATTRDQDPATVPDRRPTTGAGVPERVVPAQLPAAVAAFTGRAAELVELDGLLGEDQRTSAVVISAVSGTAGVGKTALAVHWAHRVRHRFGDGQLYVNLRGFDPTGTPMTAAEAVRRFLDALGVAPQRIPADLHAQAALYRSLLADQRMLVVLDNARDPEQVRPLLPGAPGCLVLITSRNQLTGLVAGEGAHPLTLDLLTPQEAGDLLTRRVSAERTGAEPDAVDEIITRCARLPLALAIVAARAATNPNLPLAALAAQLRDTGDRLDALTTGDTTTEIRAVFSWSYQTLTPDAARLFRLLGLHPGPDISAPAAASLAGLPPVRVRPLLAELTRAHLIAEHSPGRYGFHDLLRAYAAEKAHSHEPDEQRRTAIVRVLDHYLHTARTADRLLNPLRAPIVLTPINPGVVPEHLSKHRQAMHWFGMEHPVLLAAVDHAATTGLNSHTWQLAWTLTTFLNRRGHWHDWAAVQRAALAAAQRLADPTAQAQAHRGLADAYTRLRHYDDAHTHGRHALDLYATAGDLAGQTHTHYSLAFMREQQGRHREALDHARQALDLSRAAGHRIGQARALNMIGWLHTRLGDHQHALTTCQQALALFQEIDDHRGQAATWDSLGYAHHHHHLRQYAQAITCYQHALDLYRDLGDRYQEAEALDHLGDTHRAAGNPDAARHTWHQALSILDQLDHPDAEQIRTKLHDLDP